MKPPTSLALGTPQGGRPPAARQSRFRGVKLGLALWAKAVLAIAMLWLAVQAAPAAEPVKKIGRAHV